MEVTRRDKSTMESLEYNKHPYVSPYEKKRFKVTRFSACGPNIEVDPYYMIKAFELTNLTRMEFSSLSGINLCTLSCILNGKRFVRAQTLDKFCKTASVDFSMVLSGIASSYKYRDYLNG
jgi:hypothetical protein